MTSKINVPSLLRTRVAQRAGGLVLAMVLSGCTGEPSDSGGSVNEPSARIFEVSLESVVVVDRSDGTTLPLNGANVQGATITLLTGATNDN
ncbi:MAG: hypothetical protein AAF351_09950 [Pseudomonadota bacterium]